MKRYLILKKFLPLLKDNDLLMFFGKEVCEEAFKYDRPGCFYLPDTKELSPSLALGVAMCTNKRIFVFCEDGDFLREMGSVAQMAVSKCENLFYVILSSGRYQLSGGQPNIFNGFSAPKGFLFNLGFVVNDYVSYLKNKTSTNELGRLIKSIRGPMVILMWTDVGLKKGEKKKISYSKTDLTNRIQEFIRDEELGTSLYAPPAIGGII